MLSRACLFCYGENVQIMCAVPSDANLEPDQATVPFR
jgi:hypothetical protein